MRPLLLRARALHGALRSSHVPRFHLRTSTTALYPLQRRYITIEANGASDGAAQALEESPRINETLKPLIRKYPAPENPIKSIEPIKPIEHIKLGEHQSFRAVYLRDCCTCSSCVDPSTRQKNFQTTDIPENITAKSVVWNGSDEVEITWINDIRGSQADHVSKYSATFLQNHSSPSAIAIANHNHRRYRAWDVRRIMNELEYVDFKDYMSDDTALFRVLKLLESHGLVLLRGVPESETSVEEIGGRIGNLRDSLYGRTWDVKSVPEAKNVAYTHQSLGLHQDLLYMEDPPGFQLLHCLKNTCEGGESLFSDAFRAAGSLSHDQTKTLGNNHVAYHYKNAGEYYYNSHPVFEFLGKPFSTPAGMKNIFKAVNYSPPFQAPHRLAGERQHEVKFPVFLDAFRRFARATELPRNVLEYRMQEGECVLFNNRRVLHGRKAFETAVGERWLKGAYVDTDAYMSRYRVMSERFPGTDVSPPRESNLVFPKRNVKASTEA